MEKKEYNIFFLSDCNFLKLKNLQDTQTEKLCLWTSAAFFTISCLILIQSSC